MSILWIDLIIFLLFLFLSEKKDKGKQKKKKETKGKGSESRFGQNTVFERWQWKPSLRFFKHMDWFHWPQNCLNPESTSSNIVRCCLGDLCLILHGFTVLVRLEGSKYHLRCSRLNNLKMVISCERTVGSSNLAWGADYAACVFEQIQIYRCMWRSFMDCQKHDRLIEVLSVHFPCRLAINLSVKRTLFLLLCCLLVATSTAGAHTKPR